jgi:hypothetical protein
MAQGVAKDADEKRSGSFGLVSFICLSDISNIETISGMKYPDG